MSTLTIIGSVIGIVIAVGGIISGAAALLVRVVRWATTVDTSLVSLVKGQDGIIDRLDRGAGKIHTHAEQLAALPCRQTARGSCPDISNGTHAVAEE